VVVPYAPTRTVLNETTTETSRDHYPRERFRSPTNPSVQVSLVSGDATAPEQSLLSVNVGDVDAAYAEAQRRGDEIVHPLTQGPWGVRRFFVRDPHGIVVNIVGHPD
jgi:uncharacterized glyoxalase superfamily protein PhnB